MLLEYLIAQFESGPFLGHGHFLCFPVDRNVGRCYFLKRSWTKSFGSFGWLVLLSRAGRVVVNFLPAFIHVSVSVSGAYLLFPC